MSKDNNRVGQNIRAIREQKKMTQSYIADKVGVSKQHISRIERDGTGNQETLERIAKALFVDIQVLYEPVKEHEPLFTTKEFISKTEKDELYHTEVEPLFKRIQDMVIENYTREVIKHCHMDKSMIRDLLESKGYDMNKTYTTDELLNICCLINLEFLTKFKALSEESQI